MRMILQETEEIILAIDPGTRVSGYGLIHVRGGKYVPLDYGCIRPPPKNKLSDRYLVIFNSVEELIQKYSPTVVVVELQFVYKNPQSALKLGMARGCILIAARKNGLLVFEYAPTVAKRAVTGTGRASKHQVQKMVQNLLQLKVAPEPEDAADALALAICHAQAAPHLRQKNEI